MRTWNLQLRARLASLSQKFQEAETEKVFVQTRSADVRRHFSLGSAFLALCNVFSYCTEAKKQGLFQDPKGEELVAMVGVLKITCAATLILFALMLRWERLAKKIGAFGIEALCAGIGVFGVLQVFSSKPYYLAQVMGYNPHLVLRTTTDDYVGQADHGSLTCLMIDGVITAVHLSCPVRWFILIPMDLTGPVLYAMGSVLCEHEHCIALWPLWPLITLVLLTFFAIVGTRSIEWMHRRHLLALIKEKSQRTQTEFRLSQLGKFDSGTGSQRSTTKTIVSDTILDISFIKDDNPSAMLSQLARIGREQRWLVDYREIRLHPYVLGSGTFGLVVEGDFLGTPVAVKLPRKEITPLKPGLSDICNELSLLRHLRHPNLVAFHGACIEPEKVRLALVLELVQGITLDKIVCNPQKPLSRTGQSQLLNGICCAMHYLHSRNPAVVHGDLKGSNVMVEQQTSELRPKLLDFGLSKKIAWRRFRRGGTIQYMSPETLAGTETTCASDVFSFGRLLFFICSGTTPLLGMTDQQIRDASKLRSPEVGWPVEFCGSGLWRMGQRCLEFEPGKRPSMKEVHEAFAAPHSFKGAYDVVLSSGWSSDWNDAYSRLSVVGKHAPSGGAEQIPVSTLVGEEGSICSRNMDDIPG